MFLKTRSAALAAVIAALAVPVASASAATSPVKDLGTPRCPDGYVGPTNLATGCPWWMIH
jgi:hypothetical protein